MKREIAVRAVVARLRRRLEAEGLRLWKATRREVERFGLAAGDHIVTSEQGIVGHGSLERLAREWGALEGFEAIEDPTGAGRRGRRGRRGGRPPSSEGQGRLPL
jgi:hypothetical protein